MMVESGQPDESPYPELLPRWLPDRTLRVDASRCTVIGGSPLRLLRLTEGGMRFVVRTLGGGNTGGCPGSRETSAAPGRAERALLDRLVEHGMVHPIAAPGASGLTAVDVTVVVPVRDDPGRLARLLAALADTSPRVAGVIVVDDGSTEPLDLASLRMGEGALPFPVSVQRLDRSGGPAHARNMGLADVQTRLVAFIDADCVPSHWWLEPLLDHLADERVVVVAPRVGARRGAEGDQMLAAYDANHSPLDLGDEPAIVRPLSRVPYVPSAALLARTGTIRGMRGFDAEMRVGEDVDLIWRLVAAGHRVRYEPRSMVRHDTRAGLGSWAGQRFHYGTSAAALASRHGDKVAPAVMSRWSLAVWLLVISGHRRMAAATVAITVLLFRRRVPGVAPADVARMVVGGHLGVAKQLARTTVRAWWPIALVASTLSRRARVLLGAAVVATLVEHRPADLQQAGLALLDDVSYGAGVWVGCLRRRSPRALMPKVT